MSRFEVPSNALVYEAVRECGCGAYDLGGGRIGIKFPNGLAISVKDPIILDTWRVGQLESGLTASLYGPATEIASIQSGYKGKHSGSQEKNAPENLKAEKIEKEPDIADFLGGISDATQAERAAARDRRGADRQLVRIEVDGWEE